jgi:polyhydroxyalkanoate synthesis regulator protein
MLPIPFLRQLIAFYGDQMQMIVPSFLEQSMIAFAKEQERFREQMKSAVGKGPMEMMKMPVPMKAIEEQTRRNIELFQNAMRMFTPFPPGSGQATPAEPGRMDSDKSEELSELKEQIAAMQRKIDSMG